MKKLMKFALVAGVVVAIGKVIATQKAEWSGLTESEVRAKLDTRIPDRVPAEKRSEVADQVVSAMRDRGALRPDEEPTEDETDGGDQTAASATEQSTAPATEQSTTSATEQSEATVDSADDGEQT